MITFNEIYEILRKEKYSDKLQPLSKKFLKESQQYLKEKQEFLSKESDLFSDMAMKNKKKFENTVASIKDLLRLRKKKILNLAFIANEVGISKKDFENMLGFEKDLFQTIVKALEKVEKDKEEEMQGEQGKEFNHILVRFIEEVPSFMDFNGEEIGPFEKGEIANLESEIIEILTKDNKVEIIDDD